MSTRETGLLTAGSVIAALGALMYISVGVLQTGTSRARLTSCRACAEPIHLVNSHVWGALFSHRVWLFYHVTRND